MKNIIPKPSCPASMVSMLFPTRSPPGTMNTIPASTIRPISKFAINTCIKFLFPALIISSIVVSPREVALWHIPIAPAEK